MTLKPLSQPLLRVLRETPATRVAQAGARHASLLELIGAVLGDADTALRLLAQYPTLPDLNRAQAVDLETVYGLGPARVAALQAALELGRRANQSAPADRRLIRSPSDAADLLLAEMSQLVQEELWVLVLDARSRVITVEKVYRGNVSSSIVRPAEVFREAVRRTAPAILIAHNHPSHDPSPSPNDLDVTRDLIAAGRLLGITLRDHLIIGGGSRYVSLKERGVAFDDDED